jgi:putative phosphotransacetylase
MTPEDAANYGVENGQVVSVKVESGRTALLGDVVVRVSPKFALAMHIDTDESNAVCGFGKCYGELVK